MQIQRCVEKSTLLSDVWSIRCGCGNFVHASLSMAGQVGRCPRCGTEFRVGEGRRTSVSMAASGDQEAYERLQKTPEVAYCSGCGVDRPYFVPPGGTEPGCSICGFSVEVPHLAVLPKRFAWRSRGTRVTERKKTGLIVMGALHGLMGLGYFVVFAKIVLSLSVVLGLLSLYIEMGVNGLESMVSEAGFVRGIATVFLVSASAGAIGAVLLCASGIVACMRKIDSIWLARWARRIFSIAFLPYFLLVAWIVVMSFIYLMVAGEASALFESMKLLFLFAFVTVWPFLYERLLGRSRLTCALNA